ncbi:MAG TPA: UDP-3-O-acyl-N-acetylglucosamine deacetylase [Oligoflexia bacterium]|nr:UDP-3-O-acyl-N-acetylglucosamine deacetylase [Oligoflexia bacterium]HMP27617.1 UDP-3-O-acyl-N-acetylglucosamine deacetylase [Oligoflexia bacterium]
MNLPEKTILVVDDDPAVLKSVAGVLSDVGYRSLTADNGLEALEIISKNPPHVALIDIWMPGLDGLQTLEKVQENFPNVKTIVMSGHANIAAAVKATRLGALNFIEKPFDRDLLLKVIGNCFAAEQIETTSQPTTSPKSAKKEILINNTFLLPPTSMRGSKRSQKTLANSAVLYGHGLHSGRKSGLILEPLPPGSGIHLLAIGADASKAAPVPAVLDNVKNTGFATTIGDQESSFSTVEHLLSALCAYGITNLLIKCDKEVPIMDGSALPFCDLIEDVGIKDQKTEYYALRLNKKVSYGNQKESITIEPAEGFFVEYYLSYPEPIGEQRASFELANAKAFKDQIAPARTFGFMKDISYLQKMGLGLGGRFDNFVLLGDEGPLNGQLRFPDEMARHKILDLIGDLYLLGIPLEGKITACLTGHSDNIGLLREIAELLKREG